MRGTISCLMMVLIGAGLSAAQDTSGARRGEDRKPSAGAGKTRAALTLANVPPVVVKTVPQAGAGKVDPNLNEIQVTFSKEMRDGSWSWSTLTKESFPKVNGKPKYLDDRRTCVLPVKLEAGKTYAIWLNSRKFGNFKDAQGLSAVPYLLVFETSK